MNAARDRAWLAASLPHRGTMNLLDEVVAWDAQTLHARARGHTSPRNPLRRDGIVPIAAAIEYAAQAAAAHGVLVDAGGRSGGAGFLASARGVAFHRDRLDDVREPLDVTVERSGASAGGVVYAFRVSAGTLPIAEGRLAVVFDASAIALPAANA